MKRKLFCLMAMMVAWPTFAQKVIKYTTTEAVPKAIKVS